MKYKLINITTNQETICDKVTIDGFDYYVSEKIKGKSGLNYNYALKKLDNLTYSYPDYSSEWNFCRKVIATTNPNIDIPKVVDEVEILAELKYKTIGFVEEWRELEENNPKNEGFKEGYNKSQETHPFSEQDMIDFAEWRDKYLEELNQWKVDGSKGGEQFTTQELLNIWKEQNPKVIYYQ